MSDTLKMIVIALGVVLTIVGISWKTMTKKAVKSRGPVNGKGRRRNDKRKLDANEKRILNQARACEKSGKYEQAASAYEKIGLMREAITILEKHGKVHQAAAILKRNGIYNRAAVVYQRNGFWQDAADSYYKAKKYREAAKCAKEAKDSSLAAKCYMKAGDFTEAAQLFIDSNKTRKAANCFIKGDRLEDAIKQFKEFAEKLDSATIFKLEKEELKVVFSAVCEGDDDPGLGKLLLLSGKLEDAILSLCRKIMWEEAGEHFQLFKEDVGPKLLMRVDYGNTVEAEALARVFVANAAFSHAGVVFERVGEFDRAGEAFEKAGDKKRAIHCYERAGNREKLEELNGTTGAKTSESVEEKSAEDTGMGGRFAMENAASILATPESKKFEQSDPMESTEILSNEAEVNGEQNPFAEEQDSESESPVEPATENGPPGTNLFSIGESEEGSRPTFSSTEIEQTDPAFNMSTFFQNLDPEQSFKLWAIGETFDFEDGQSILSYNDDPLGLYVVLAGQIDCYRMLAGKSTFVDSMAKGDVFGEVWLLVEHPTSVRFIANGPAKVRILRREKFNDLLDREGSIARKLYKHFASRLLKRLLSAGDARKGEKAS